MTGKMFFLCFVCLCNAKLFINLMQNYGKTLRKDMLFPIFYYICTNF